MIVSYPNQILRSKCLPVLPENYTKAADLAWNMLRLMEGLEAIGLSAPQVGSNASLIVYNVHEVPMIMINPVIETKSENVATDREGCLSFPGLRIEVDRSTSVVVNYIDQEGNVRKRECSGIEAVVVQHEIDHINGVLFIDYSPKVKKSIHIGAMKGHFHQEARRYDKIAAQNNTDLDVRLNDTISALQ